MANLVDIKSEEYSDFKFSVQNNVCDLDLKNKNVAKRLKAATHIVDKKAKRLNFVITLEQDDTHLFNDLLDAADVNIEELTGAIDKAHDYFNDYEVSRKTQNVVDRYISKIGNAESTWHGLTSKPDYNLSLFRRRMLPYFSLECKDWIKANLDAMKGEYPTEIVRAAKKNKNTQDEYSEELDAVTMNNNFLEWSLLPVDKYPNMEKLTNRIKVLHKLGMKRQALLMFLKLLISPRECHIFRELSMWEIFKPQMKEEKYVEEIVRYCCCYAMYILRQEETIMFSQVNSNYRVLFTLEQAANIPTFSTCHIERHPYILQLTDNSRLSDSMIFYIKKGRKINSKEVFDRRFHIATGGAFKGVDLRALGAAITGSILIPCVHTSPLEKGCENIEWPEDRNGTKVPYPFMIDNPTTPEDMAFAKYLEMYYPGYASLTDEEYKLQLFKDISRDDPVKLAESDNIVYENDEAKESVNNITTTINVVSQNTVHQAVNTTVNRVIEKKEVDTDSDNDEDVELPIMKLPLKKSVKKHIKRPIKKFTKKRRQVSKSDSDDSDSNEDIPHSNNTRKNPQLPKMEVENKSIKATVEYNQLADIDISISTKDFDTFKKNTLQLYDAIVKNCSHRGPVYIKEVKTLATVKYKVYGPGLSRPMDIFRIPYEPVKMVKKFHVHAVKMYYDNDVTMFRSCVACLLSGVGESYKWFVCSKVPADVLLKYAQRGLTIILNKKERDAISKYITENERWGAMLKHLKISADKIYCCVAADHPFFHPGAYNCGIRMNLRKIENDMNGKYSAKLVVPESTYVFPFGELNIKDGKKMYPPNIQSINACLDYIDNQDDDIIDDE